MIPKTIHYCWFSGDPYPKLIAECIESWHKVLPDYTFKKWDADNTDFDIPFAKKAFAEKKWAFLTDYIRFKALYEEGGIFLDTDIMMVKPFNDLLNYQSFWGRADNNMIEPVVIGAVPHNEIINKCKNIYAALTEKDLLNYSYKELPLVVQDIFRFLKAENTENQNNIINENIFLNYKAFCPMPFNKADSVKYSKYISEETYCVHMWNAAWFEDEFRFFWNNRWQKAWKLVWKRIKKNPFQSRSYYKDVSYHFLRQIKLK